MYRFLLVCFLSFLSNLAFSQRETVLIKKENLKKEKIKSLILSPDDHVLFIVYVEHVMVWDLQSRRLVGEIEGGAPITLSSEGDKVYLKKFEPGYTAQGSYSYMRVFNLEEWKVEKDLQPYLIYWSKIVADPLNKRLAIGSAAGWAVPTLRVLDLSTREVMEIDAKACNHPLMFSSDGQTLYFEDEEGLKKFDFNTKSTNIVVDRLRNFMSPKANYLAHIQDNGQVAIENLKSGARQKLLPADKRMGYVVFSPDERFIAIASSDRRYYKYDYSNFYDVIGEGQIRSDIHIHNLKNGNLVTEIKQLPLEEGAFELPLVFLNRTSALIYHHQERGIVIQYIN